MAPHYSQNPNSFLGPNWTTAHVPPSLPRPSHLLPHWPSFSPANTPTHLTAFALALPYLESSSLRPFQSWLLVPQAMHLHVTFSGRPPLLAQSHPIISKLYFLHSMKLFSGIFWFIRLLSVCPHEKISSLKAELCVFCLLASPLELG